MKKTPATLKDIALKLNLSVSTVSRALSGKHRISEKTRREVTDLAKKMNYHPNPIAIHLLRSRTYTVGVIIPEITFHFFSSIISGIEDVALKAGYNIIIGKSNDQYDREKMVTETLELSRVDGILASYSCETSQFSHFEELYKKGIALVFFDRSCDQINVPSVTTNDVAGAFHAVEHLIQQGCKKIAHFVGPENLSTSKNRLKGYLKALKKYDIPIDESIIFHFEFDKSNPGKTVQATKELLNLPHRPDAIFAFNDYVAYEVMEIIKSKSLKIPEDIAIVGFANEPIANYVEPKLTTVAQPSFRMGQIGMKLLLSQIESDNENYQMHNKVLKTKLIVRDSSLIIKD